MPTLPEIKRKLIGEEISLVDALQTLRVEAGAQLTEYRLLWIDQELNGYPCSRVLVEKKSFELPHYRQLSGQYFARTPSGFWVDVSDTSINDLPAFCGIAIGTIEDFIAGPDNEHIDVQLQEILEDTAVVVRVKRAHLIAVEEAVRNIIIKLIDELQSG